MTEVGQRLAVDRCNVIRPRTAAFASATNTWATTGSRRARAQHPTTLVPQTRSNGTCPTRATSIDDIQSANIPLWVRTTLQLIGTRSVLVAPFVFRDELLGDGAALLQPAAPLDGDRSEAGRVAGRPGLHRAAIHAALPREEKEVEITKLMLEISNDINTRTDFNEITDFVIDRALELLKADYGCIAILDNQGEYLHFDELRARRASICGSRSSRNTAKPARCGCPTTRR